MNANIELIGNRLVLVLPQEVATRLNVSDGGQVGVIASPNGVELVTDLEVAHQLEVARGVMRDDHDALRELAK